MDIFGDSSDPFRWVVRGDIPSPIGYVPFSSPWSGVVHLVRNPDPEQPWKGQGVLPALTSRTAWTAETHTADRLAGAFGHLLAIQLEDKGDSVSKETLQGALMSFIKHRSQLRGDVATLATKGESLTLADMDVQPESAKAAVDAAAVSAAANAALRDGALVPFGLMPGNATTYGLGMARESMAAFIDIAIEPLAKQMSAELSAKLGAEVTLSAESLRTADSRSRAQSVKAFVEAGFSLDEAARLAGLMIPAAGAA